MWCLYAGLNKLEVQYSMYSKGTTSLHHRCQPTHLANFVSIFYLPRNSGLIQMPQHISPD